MQTVHKLYREKKNCDFILNIIILIAYTVKSELKFKTFLYQF
jgi:hypothetical protein